MKMKVAGKENLMTRNFSSSVIKEFNGYEVIKHELAHEEKKFIPIDIVYEPRYNESFPVLYLSTDEIYLAYRSYIGKMIRWKEKKEDLTVKDCYYCENYFARNNGKMKKHLEVCAGKAIYIIFNNEKKAVEDLHQGSGSGAIYFTRIVDNKKMSYFYVNKIYIL